MRERDHLDMTKEKGRGGEEEGRRRKRIPLVWDLERVVDWTFFFSLSMLICANSLVLIFL